MNIHRSSPIRAVILVFASMLLPAWAAAAARETPPEAGQIAVATIGGRIVLVNTAGHRFATLTGRAGVVDWAPAWSPDGKWLAFARSTDGRRSFHVYVMRADGSRVRQLTQGRFDESPAWSPDGRWIAYASEGGIRIVHPNGHGTRLVRGTGISGPDYSTPFGAMPSWTPRGRLSYAFHPEISADWPATCHVARAHCGWVFAADRDGRNRSPVLRGRDAHWSADGRAIVFTPSNGGVAILTGGRRHFLGHGYLANWSPDGTRIVYARMGMTEAGDAIWIMDATGHNRHRILSGASDPAWRPLVG